MRNLDKRVSIKLSVVIVITIIALLIFSIPLGIIPPLGGLLFPGNGLWKVPGEVPLEEQLSIEGLSDNVYIIRDEWGIPHIYGSNESDISFALGYCHAQDRLFQMDMIRRQVRGMLSEVIGVAALEADKFNLATGMEYWANKTLERAKNMANNGEFDYLNSMNCYIKGINYYISSHKNEKPLEYYLLGFEPAEFTLLDSFCILKYMSRMFTWQYGDLYRLMNFDAFNIASESWYLELFNPYKPYQIPVCPGYGEYPDISIPKSSGMKYEPNPSLKGTIANFLIGIENIDSEKDLIESQDAIGSNNWVVNGSKTSTGKPILCNDMHFLWTMPGILYEAHTISNDTGFNTYGFTIPGTPLPVVGHNQYIGWGLTISAFDATDWYYYTNISTTHYIYNGATTAYTTRSYAINVKNQDPVEFTVKETVHGPVLNEFFNTLIPELIPESLDKTNIILAPKWLSNNITYEFMAYCGMNYAHNWSEFNNSLSYLDAPAVNVAYADIYGNIAIRPTGKVPIRDDSKNPTWHPGNGTLPYNGSNGEGEWIGCSDFNKLPYSLNPTQKYLTSSNQISAGPNYKTYFLQNTYFPGYRARRLNELLNKAPDGTISVEKMMEIQLDINSTAAHAFTPYLIAAIENYYSSSIPTNINNILPILKNWNYIMDKELIAPTIYRKWRDFFMDNTFGDEFKKYNATYSPPFNPSLAVLEYLMKENETSHWFDDINTIEVVETRDDIILNALNNTIIWLEEFYGSSDPSDWRWGNIHKIYFGHITGMTAFSKGPYDGDGEGFTVNPARVDLSSGVGLARVGPCPRFIVDFNDLNNSRSVIPAGQRGLSNSKHYSDQLEQLFIEGKYHYEYFTNTLNNFPASSIESRIYFKPMGGS